MFILILGILIFLGVHTLTTLRQTRAGLVSRIGEGPYKGLYSLAAGIGFALIIWGFARYRADNWMQLWAPPAWGRHVTMALMWFAFVALAASGSPGGRIRGWLRHPMLVGVKIWALAHLIANGDAGGLVLFGSFLAWAIYDRIAIKRRGDVGAPSVAQFTRADLIVVGGGSVAYVAMIFLHPVLIGVAVIGQ